MRSTRYAFNLTTMQLLTPQLLRKLQLHSKDSSLFDVNLQRLIQAGGLPFSAARPDLLYSPLARSSVICEARRKFTFFIWKHGPPALQWVSYVATLEVTHGVEADFQVTFSLLLWWKAANIIFVVLSFSFQVWRSIHLALSCPCSAPLSLT